MAHDFKKFPELWNHQMIWYYHESPHKQITESFWAKVVKVTDGDTIRVKCEFRDFDFPVRLLDLAAPELNEEGGRESKSWLEEQIKGEDIEVLIDPENRVGKFGRLLGTIIHKGLNINTMSLFNHQSISFEEDQDAIDQD